MDCFPARLSTDVPELVFSDDDLRLREMALNGRVLVFSMYCAENVVLYQSEHVNEKVWDRKLFNNFLYTLKAAQTMNPFHPKGIIWQKIAQKLEKPTNRKHVNVDRRISYAFPDNVYLVKEKFTFGQRLVEPDTCHLFQIWKVPVLIYRLKEGGRKPVVRTRAFEPNDQFCYDGYVLQPNTKYLIGPGERYVVLTLQKCILSVHVVNLETITRLKSEKKFTFRKPFSKKILVDDPYDVDAPVRRIEQVREETVEKNRTLDFYVPADEVVERVSSEPECVLKKPECVSSEPECVSSESSKIPEPECVSNESSKIPELELSEQVFYNVSIPRVLLEQAVYPDLPVYAPTHFPAHSFYKQSLYFVPQEEFKKRLYEEPEQGDAMDLRKKVKLNDMSGLEELFTPDDVTLNSLLSELSYDEFLKLL